MDVLGMFAFCRNGKAEHTLGVGTLVRQTVFNQPVEYAIKRDTIERRFAQGLFDLVVAQGPGVARSNCSTRMRAGVARAPQRRICSATESGSKEEGDTGKNLPTKHRPI